MGITPIAPQDGQGRPAVDGREAAGVPRRLDSAAAALDRLQAVGLRVRPDGAALVLGALIALFVLLGSLYRLGAPLALFDLDGEGKPPAAFAGALLIGAGLLAWTIARTAAEHPFRGRWMALGSLFLFVGVDEMLTIHESLADRAGVWWQLLYVPVGLLAAGAWLLVLRRLRHDRPERLLFVCAPAVWALSQVFETVQNEPSDRVGGYAVMATAEESLEMVGSTLFLLALLRALQRRGSTQRQEPSG